MLQEIFLSGWQESFHPDRKFPVMVLFFWERECILIQATGCLTTQLSSSGECKPCCLKVTEDSARASSQWIMFSISEVLYGHTLVGPALLLSKEERNKTNFRMGKKKKRHHGI